MPSWFPVVSLFKLLSGAERSLAQISTVIPRWVKASQSADLNLFNISASFPQGASGRYRQVQPHRLTSFACGLTLTNVRVK